MMDGNFKELKRLFEAQISDLPTSRRERTHAIAQTTDLAQDILTDARWSIDKASIIKTSREES